MSPLKINKVLVIYNKPLYQQHILETKDPPYHRLLKNKHPTTRNWKKVHQQHHRTLEGVMRTLNLLGLSTDSVYRKEIKKIGPYDLVITVGGDGTLLEASHHLEKQVLLGVNGTPMDSMGALCRARLDNFLGTLIDLLDGDLKPQKVPRLRVKVGPKILPDPALNEVLFANQSPAGTSRYFIQVGKRSEEHKSSGVWIATGAGSTAALSSAGGKKMRVSHAGMQYLVREPFAMPGKKLRLTGGILPKGKKLVLTPTMRQAAIFIDGNHIEIPIPYGEKVEITSNWKPLKMVL